MRKYNLITGIIWLALANFIFFESIQLGLGKLRFPGPGFLPILTSISLGLLSILLILEAITKKDDKKGEEMVWATNINWNKIILSLFALTIYALLLERLGYILSTFLLMLLLFKVAGMQKWIRVGLASIIAVILSYIIFGLLLQIQFPGGIIEGIILGI